MKKENKISGTRKIIFVSYLVLSVFGFAGFIIKIYSKIVSGHGLDTYFTGWGVKMNYIGVLITLILIPILLLGGWIISKVVDWYEMKDLKKRS